MRRGAKLLTAMAAAMVGSRPGYVLPRRQGLATAVGAITVAPAEVHAEAVLRTTKEAPEVPQVLAVMWLGEVGKRRCQSFTNHESLTILSFMVFGFLP